MKKIKLLLASLMCLGLLTGCSFKDFFNKSSEPEVVQPSGDEPSEPEQPGEPETPEVDPVLVSIAVSGQFKTEYEVGEEFDSTGIVVTAHFDKGEDKDVTAEASFSGFDSSAAVQEQVITVSFGGKETSFIISIVEPIPEGLSPEEAIAEIASYWGGSAQEVQSGVFGVYGAFPASSYSVDDMKNFVSNLFVPEEFELVSDWEVAEDGTNSCMYANAVLTVLEIYVYADTVYVKDGRIVEEGTEGAVATDVTCIEVYSYTYSE